MRGLFISLLFFVILLLAIVFGALARSDSSDPAADSADNPSVKSPFPLTPPKRDTTILAAPDGTIYLVERTTRKIVWSFSSGASIYSSYQALPSSDDDAFAEGDNFYIDCGEDWKLYVHGNGFKKKLPLNAEDLLRQTPYVSAGGGVMLSSKKTTVFLVEADTGKLVRSFKSDNFSLVENRDAPENPIVAKKDFEQYITYSDAESKAISKPLYVMRTDYSMKYTSSKTGKMMWYLTFADIEASFQCEGIETLLDGISYEKQFGPGDSADIKLPLDCHISLPVYRTRDRSSLESLFMSDGLLKSLPGDELLSLPTADKASILKPLDKLFMLPQNNDGKVPALPTTETELLSLPTADQASTLKPRDKLFLLPHNNEDGKVLALPSTETENNGILSLPGNNGSEMNVNAAYDSNAGIQFWPSAFISTLLLLVVSFPFVRRLAVGKKSKLQKDAGDLIAQTLTPKKKKARKAGMRNSSNDKKKQKDVSVDERISATNGRSNLEITERSFQLTFSEGYLDGRKIGKLVLSNKEIAKGSNGTVVLEGYYDGRPVAVKRLVQTHHDVALKEIQNLIASDQHPNIVRWYGVEYDQDFVYLSLERCTCSLDELISSYSSSYQNQESSHGEYHDSLSDCTLRLQYKGADDQDFKLWKANGYPSPQLLKLMRDTVYGLAHLHELGIVHRDLKPQNVLVIKERSLCAKLSDMGISKRLAGNMSALTRHATGYGSSGWQAPEQLREERQTRAVDLFSLGCVFFFCITGGQHPFGGFWERDGNIFRNQKDLFLIESLPEAKDLISRLLDPKPELRPKTGEILSHPFFWNPEMRLSFLRDASDRVELEDRTNDSQLLETLERVATVSFGGKWDEKLETTFINDIGRYRRYKFDSLRDLLRVIRNKLNHYRELSTEVQEILGNVPEGFNNYFSARFPNLLIEVYKVIHMFCAEEDNFRKYFVSNQL